jgi:hypothetical protein
MIGKIGIGIEIDAIRQKSDSDPDFDLEQMERCWIQQLDPLAKMRVRQRILRRIDETKLPDCAGFSSACEARTGAHSPAM